MSSCRRKLVIVGDRTVGKTSLIHRFVKGQFDEDLRPPTVFENYVADLHVDQKKLELALWDTAGQDEYDRLRPLSYPDTNIVLIAFSVAAPESLEHVTEKWISEVSHYTPGTPIILVGCKVDLRHDEGILKALAGVHQRPVSVDEGMATAAKIGAKKYTECSAKSGEGVSEAFETAARASLIARRYVHPHRCVVL
ncbi:protein rho1 [Flagelloscypha sp. PMI_526]|nr:protein rho1 [Flagelloscypha sp. PMI_526]